MVIKRMVKNKFRRSSEATEIVSQALVGFRRYRCTVDITTGLVSSLEEPRNTRRPA